MFRDGLSYPFRGERGVARVVLGGGLLYLSFLLVPALFVVGYLYRVLEYTAFGEDDPPAFEEPVGTMVDGLRALAVAAVYVLVPALVARLADGAVEAALGTPPGRTATLFGMLALGLVYYSVPAALARLAHHGRLRAAFAPGAILPVVFSADYFLAALVPLVVGSIAVLLTLAVGFLLIVFLFASDPAAILGLLAVVSVAGVAFPFVQFYLWVAVFRMFGLAYRDAVDAATLPEDVL